MEMDENRLIAEGFSRDEIAAAILRGTAASYYYKFVGGSQHVGHNCSAQGGPALGKAFLAALAQVTERQIEAYPHREMFGAWGQALDIIEQIRRLEQEGKPTARPSAAGTSSTCPSTNERSRAASCLGTRPAACATASSKSSTSRDDEIITGGFCPRGNSERPANPRSTTSTAITKSTRSISRSRAPADRDRARSTEGPTVGIKRSMATLGEKGIWSAALFRKLGFFPVVSPRSDKDIAKIGVDNSRTEFCIARKLATGHAAVLNDHPDVEYLFNPSFIEHRKDEPPDLKYCIYTESEGYVLNDVLSLDKNRQFNPILHFGDLPLLVREIRQEFDRVGFPLTDKQINEAIAYADEAEKAFQQELYAEGDKFLERIEREGTPGLRRHRPRLRRPRSGGQLQLRGHVLAGPRARLHPPESSWNTSSWTSPSTSSSRTSSGSRASRF